MTSSEDKNIHNADENHHSKETSTLQRDTKETGLLHSSKAQAPVLRPARDQPSMPGAHAVPNVRRQVSLDSCGMQTRGL